MKQKLLYLLFVVGLVVTMLPLPVSAQTAPSWPAEASLFTFSLTANATELKWPEANDVDGDLVRYDILVDNVDVADVLPNTGDEAGVGEVVIQGLNTYQIYDFSVIAVDAEGLQSVALVALDITQFAPPVWPAGAEVLATNITHQSASLSWPVATDADGEIIAYEINGYRDPGDGGPYEQFMVEQVAGNVHNYNVTGLDSETLYYFLLGATDDDFAQAFAADPIGDPGDLVDVEFTTLETPPPPPPGTPSTVGAVDPTTGLWRLRNSTGAITTFFYGVPGDIPMMGDWDGNGTDTPGLYRQSNGFVYLRNSNTQGPGEISYFFGIAGDIPIAGDFDDDGDDTVSIYRPSEGKVYVINSLGTANADFSYFFGLPGDKPFAGDFNGDGRDTVGLHRESSGFVYFRNTNTQGVADFSYFFGIANDRLVAGDWGVVDGNETAAVFRPGNQTWYFRHSHTQGNADSQFQWGESHWLPVSGKFGLG